jgi:uncharacterized membrane protein YidH (DUF202 family)
MGKYRRESSQSLMPSKNSRPMHAVWRGVGFGMMILIPVMSYALARLFLDENVNKGWITFPKNMYLQNPPLPNDLLILILIMIVFMLVMYAIFTLFSLIIFRLFAPPRYGPLDVPPITYHGKNYKR